MLLTNLSSLQVELSNTSKSVALIPRKAIACPTAALTLLQLAGELSCSAPRRGGESESESCQKGGQANGGSSLACDSLLSSIIRRVTSLHISSSLAGLDDRFNLVIPFSLTPISLRGIQEQTPTPERLKCDRSATSKAIWRSDLPPFLVHRGRGAGRGLPEVSGDFRRCL